MWFDFARGSLFFFVVHFAVTECQLPNLQPGDFAPSFALQTLNGRIVYKKSNASSNTPRNPVIFHLFTRRSAFLEALWTNDTSLQEFIELSPRNTHYVFMSSSDSNAMEDVFWLRKRLYEAIENYFERWVKSCLAVQRRQCDYWGLTLRENSFEAGDAGNAAIAI